MHEGSRTLSLDILSKYKNKYFFESGTFKGGGIATALQVGFSNIISVEIDYKLATSSMRQFKNHNNVLIVYGDTAKILYQTIKSIRRPITFWLDGHVHCEGAVGIHPVPLLDELEQISRHHIKDHTILIDDRRLMGKVADNWVGHFWESTTEELVYAAIKSVNPNYTISYEASPHGAQDIIVARV
jgi:hypothetical protein